MNARSTLRRPFIGLLVVVGLVVFHALLLWQRLESSTLLQPAVAARWAGTMLLLLFLRHLVRRGLPLLHGRRALIFWLPVLLLHLSFSAPLGQSIDGLAEVALEPTILIVAPALLSATLLGRMRSRHDAGAPRRATALQLYRLGAVENLTAGLGLGDRTLPSLASRPPPF